VQAQEIKSQNVFNVDLKITTEQRALANGHAGGILWFTGLSGSGKSTLALELQQRLFQKGYQAYVLDGDNIRQGLNADLGFAPEDRTENIRRVGEVASLFAKAGFIVISAFISPYREDRRRARAAAPEYFHNVYIKADVETCEQRDVKGLYAKARAGEIKEFTGISAPYEEPENPELAIDTQALSVDASVEQLLAYVERQFVDPVRDPEHYSGNFLAQDI
jgi:bifunctional enzyme CysN/CysC